MSRKGCLNRKDILFGPNGAPFGHKIANTELTSAYVLRRIDADRLARDGGTIVSPAKALAANWSAHHCINRRRSGIPHRGVVGAPDFFSLHVRKLVLNPVAVEEVLAFRMVDAKREIPCVAARP